MQKHLVLQVEPSSSLGFEPAHNKARVNLESCKTKRTLYMPGGLLMGDPDNWVLLYMKACFSPNQIGFLQKSCDEFLCSSEQDLTVQPPAGRWSLLRPSRPLAEETRDSAASLLQILLFFIIHRGIQFW